MKFQTTFPIAISVLLTACNLPLAKDSKVGVEISGVNYSDQAITYAISDPNDSRSVGAEPLDPFTGGGIMCCFRLPEKWQPGIKVRVQIFDTYRDPVKDVIVDLPHYVDGKPGRIWAVHYQDGAVDVLSSDYGPPHPKWPGKVKGWPVPTLEYRRKLWERDLDREKSDVRTAEKLLKNLRDNPKKSLEQSWEFDKKHSRKEIANFHGPDDPAYKEHVQRRYEEYLEDAQKGVENLMKRKP
ncbi:MAG TPA: DUF3304 domain-containing protein [Noviherbaspirillum sp.]|nr:DUF3304 domain-containing protein [Noviherbaspirillum sp.]